MSRQQIPRAIARILFNVIGSGCILALTASSFDTTEMVALGAIAFLLVVVEAAVMCATVEPWWKRSRDGKARPDIALALLCMIVGFAATALLWWKPARATFIEDGFEYTAHRYPLEPRAQFVRRALGDVESLSKGQ